MTIANPIKNGINAADLNESQTFEQKVQALIREGKSRESAEKIVGSFVHKEAAGGNGMGGGANSSGSGGMSGGGTLTTDSGGTNNPVHNNGCDCTCKDCERNDKCDCCEKCKRKSKGLDISNTNSVGTSSAYNQDAPNGSRLNNKSHKAKATREVNKVHALMKLNEVRKEMIGVGTGIRGGGSSYAHTQGQGKSTQVTIVPPRPEDDRVASKKVKNRKE